MLTSVLYILLAILMLSVLIVIHELGHYAVGRLCGIGVVEFSVGMGPKLFGWQRKGIDYSIRAFPIGGFCKFVGEDDNDIAPNAMNNMPVWKRFLTVLAGPGMNFLLAFVVGVVMMMAVPYVEDIVPRIDNVVPDQPAYEAGLEAGDVITAINGEAVGYSYEGVTALRDVIQRGNAAELTIDRNGETLHISLQPAEIEQEDGTTRPQIGIEFTQVTRRDGFFEALGDSARIMWRTTTQMLDILRKLIFKGEGAENMAGAVGTVAVVSNTLKSDLSMIFDYMFLISLNLGIMNLIPFPGLDGSRLLFLAIEAVRRKPVPPEKEGLVHAIGLVLLLGLMVVITWHDIVTYIL